MAALLTASGKGAPLTPTEADANMTALETRTGQGWFDIVSEFYTRGGPAAPGVSAFLGGIYLLEFTDTDTLEAFANFHIPHAYKPKTISPDTAKAIEAIIASLNLPVEPIAPTIDNDDDETMELLLTL